MALHACNPNTCKAEAGGSRLSREFKVSLNYTRFYLKKEEKIEAEDGSVVEALNALADWAVHNLL